MIYPGKLTFSLCLFSLCLFCLGIAALPVEADEFPYIFEPELSLVGECGASGIDPIEDPGCPGGNHPPSGRFKEPWGVAIDAYGNEYVTSYAGTGTEGRIDVFDDDGFFLTELPDPNGPRNVAVDSKGNLYVIEQNVGKSPQVVRYAPSVYKPASGEIAYKNPPVALTVPGEIKNGLAVDLSNDHLYLAQGKSITEYGSAEEGSSLLNTIAHPMLSNSVRIAVDGEHRRLFSSYCGKTIFECGVLVFEADPPYNLLKEVDGSNTPAGKFYSTGGWLSTAVDEESGHFVVEDLEATKKVYEFDENYEYLATVENEGFQGGSPLQVAISNSPLNPIARNRHYLFVPVALAAGRVFAFEPPSISPPEVQMLQAINFAETEAEVWATIDPHGGDTAYAIEIEGPGIEGAETVAQGTILGTSLPKRVGGLVSDLEPGATYSVHAFAENDASNDKEDIFFATFSDAPLVNKPPCSNEVLRSGASANLPDCRAYELVTPADSNGRPTIGGVAGDRFPMSQSSPSGDAVSFEVKGGLLPGAEGTGGFFGDPYRAIRGASGWSAALVGPTGTEASQPQPGSFSPDQGLSFWVASGEGTAVVDNQESHYVRYPDGHSELVGRGSTGTAPTARGRLITEGGTHIVFQTFSFPGIPAIKLEENAPEIGINAVYDRTADEVTHVVSLLPGDITPSSHSAYLGASPDGAGIAFENEGTLYLRLNNATTFQIGSKGAKFAGVSEEGKRTFYLEGGDLKAFDTAEEKVIDFTETGDALPVNVAPQGNRAYFVSEEAIGGSGPNPNGDEPQLGEQNLYRSDEGSIGFVATVTEPDVEGISTPSDGNFEGLGLWTDAMERRQPARSPSRVTPDGGTLLFQSRANLDGYDPGEFAQVYRYDVATNSLGCISCPPTLAPASDGAALQSLRLLDLSAPLESTSFVPNLRADGARAFFESTEALVSSDTDEVRDVYEWEEEGIGSCTRAGGCIYLISSGHSARANYLFGHSASGDDVFFTTGDVLVGGDEDTPSVYDARVNGGFAEPSSLPCIDETCRGSASPPPPLSTPSQGAGEGNVTPAKTCPRGKRKVVRHGKQVCIKKKHRKHKKHRQKR